MSRMKNRKVKVTIKARKTEDALRYLKEVEAIYNSKDMEIEIHQDADSSEVTNQPQVVDEQLEQEVVEDVRIHLDARDNAIKKEHEAASTQSQSTSPEAIASKRKNIVQFVKDAVASGYHITVKAITEALMGK